MYFNRIDSQSSGLLLREDPDEEVGLVVGLKGGGDQQVVPRRQREALRHLPHVDVGLAASLGRMVAEEIFPCLVLVVWSLNGWRNKRSWLHASNTYSCILHTACKRPVVLCGLILLKTKSKFWQILFLLHVHIFSHMCDLESGMPKFLPWGGRNWNLMVG